MAARRKKVDFLLNARTMLPACNNRPFPHKENTGCHKVSYIPPMQVAELGAVLAISIIALYPQIMLFISAFVCY